MATKKKAAAKKRFAVTVDGKKHIITGEIGRYWICDEDRNLYLRKGNVTVEEIEVQEPEPKDE